MSPNRITRGPVPGDVSTHRAAEPAAKPAAQTPVPVAAEPSKGWAPKAASGKAPAKSEGFAAAKAAGQKAPAAIETKSAEKGFWSSVGDSFSAAEQKAAAAISGTAQAVGRTISHAGEAVAQAGRAVENAGHQVVDSGAALLNAAGKATGDAARIAADAGQVALDAGKVAIDAGKAAYHAGAAAVSGDPGELDLAHKAIGQARDAVKDARGAVADAHRQVADLGKQGTAVSGALSAAGRSLSAAETTIEHAAKDVKQALGAAIAAPRQMAESVGKAIGEGGREVKEALKRAPGGNELIDGSQKYLDGAKRAVDGYVHGNAGELVDGLRQEVSGLKDLAVGSYKLGKPVVADFVTKTVEDFKNGFDVNKNIEDLKPGDKYAIGIGANAHIEFGAEAGGNLEVSRGEGAKSNEFTLKVGGEAGVNAYLDLGVKAGPAGKASASAAAHLTGGASLEMSFDKKADAQRAASILQRQAMILAAPNPLAQAALAKAIGPTADELAFIKKHTTGVELTGSLAGELEAAAGIGGGPVAAGIGAKLGLKGGEAVKVELEDGKPVSLSIKREYEGEIGLEAGAGLQWPGGDKKAAPKAGAEKEKEEPVEVPTGVSLGATGKAVVSLETKYKLPESVTLEELKKDPVAALSKGLVEMKKTEETTAHVEVEYSVEGKMPFKKGNKHIQAELDLKGNVDDILKGKALDNALHGRFTEAVDELAKKVTVEGRVRTFTEKTVGGEQEFDMLGVGLGAKLESVNTHYDEPMLKYGHAPEAPKAAPPPMPTLRAGANLRG